MPAPHAQTSNQDSSAGALDCAVATLRDVIQTLVVPQLIARHNPRRELLLPVDLRVGERIHQLTSANAQAGRRLIKQFYAKTHSMRALCTHLIEPAARGLVDL